MKRRIFLCSALFCACAQAQVTTAAADRELYLDYLERNAQAGVCSERLPDFSARLAPLLRKWKVRHESQLRLGDSFIHAEAVRDQISVEERMAQATRDALAKIRATPDADLASACAKVTDWFEGKSDRKAADKPAASGTRAAAAAAPG